MALILRNKTYHAVIYNPVTKKQDWESLKTKDWKVAQIKYAELLKERLEKL